MNTVKPGSIPKVNDSTMPFKQMENISNFLQACRKELSMAENDLFTTPDVFDERSAVNTINGIINFSRAATKGGFKGPSIAPKEADKGTGKKWEVGSGDSSGATKMSMGSEGIMERPHLDTTKDIGFGAKNAGTGSGDVPILNMGSANTMERTTISKSNDIDFGAKSSKKN